MTTRFHPAFLTFWAALLSFAVQPALEVPESKNALNVIVGFLDRHLGNSVDSQHTSTADSRGGAAVPHD